MCMSRAIIMAWANQIKTDECLFSKEYPSIEEAILCEGKMSNSYYKYLFRTTIKNDRQTKLAALLCEKAGVNKDIMSSLNDIQHFEHILNRQILVIISSLNNKFIHTGTDNDVKLYLYFVGDNHFHAITSITGFFRRSYFCDLCLKAYSSNTRHTCEKKCLVCKRDECILDEELKCDECNMVCRSKDCLDSHKIPTNNKSLSQCDRYKRCKTCYKVVDNTVRNISEHICGEWLCNLCGLYVSEEHQCYQRVLKHEPSYLKHMYFDFETTLKQNECPSGYKASNKLNCTECQLKQSGAKCNTCSKCENCSDTLCGKNLHVVNYCISQTICDECKDAPLNEKSTCNSCGSRCGDCDSKDKKTKCYKKQPCPQTCGFRQCKFNTSAEFCEFLFTSNHTNFTAIAHNMKGFDGMFLLEYCLESTIKLNNIIYSGSKIMSMHVGIFIGRHLCQKQIEPSQ
jgi:hypothetical protein